MAHTPLRTCLCLCRSCVEFKELRNGLLSEKKSTKGTPPSIGEIKHDEKKSKSTPVNAWTSCVKCFFPQTAPPLEQSWSLPKGVASDLPTKKKVYLSFALAPKPSESTFRCFVTQFSVGKVTSYSHCEKQIRRRLKWERQVRVFTFLCNQVEAQTFLVCFGDSNAIVRSTAEFMLVLYTFQRVPVSIPMQQLRSKRRITK